MGSGAGLGISICKQLVGLMKGALPPTELGLGLGLRLGLGLGLRLGLALGLGLGLAYPYPEPRPLPRRARGALEPRQGDHGDRRAAPG